ncbi:response regulator [Paenibacillus oryzisoli]|uniref:response regulator transcription factor n=1 Tax=Paenibacillus oryzisoli TaxID=1850517 RepID=UPI003D2B43EC
MYNVLLVDDEPSHLLGLSKLLGRIRPHYIIHTAKNGIEALNACKSCDYQIIISDIQMPVMDGLKFAEQLYDRNKPLKIVFLTAHSDFEYAQKAIVLGSFEYVLKPVDKQQFTAVLERAEKSLQQEMLQMQEHAMLEGRLKSTVHFYRNHLINDWLMGGEMTQETSSELKVLGLGGGGILLIAELQVKSEEVDRKRGKSKLEIKNLLYQTLGKRGACYLIEPDITPNQVIAISETIPNEQLISELTDLIEVLSSSGQLLFIGLSRWSDKLAESGAKLYHEALLSIESGFYASDRRPILADRSCIDPKLILIHSSKDDASFSDAVFGTGVHKADLAVSSLFDRLLRSERYPRPQELVRYVQELLCKLIQSAEFLHMEVREALILKVRTSLSLQSNLGDLQSETSKRVDELAEAVVSARREHKETQIYRCMAYIEEHYMEDLSLESVAAVFEFNAAYFSQYFKNKLNINFIQYLTQLRLSKAKEFLENTDEKVYQIATRLGYNDVKYFNRVFKKELGITPEEYRSISRNLKRGES